MAAIDEKWVINVDMKDMVDDLTKFTSRIVPGGSGGASYNPAQAGGFVQKDNGLRSVVQLLDTLSYVVPAGIGAKLSSKLLGRLIAGGKIHNFAGRSAGRRAARGPVFKPLSFSGGSQGGRASWPTGDRQEVALPTSYPEPFPFGLSTGTSLPIPKIIPKPAYKQGSIKEVTDYLRNKDPQHFDRIMFRAITRDENDDLMKNLIQQYDKTNASFGRSFIEAATKNEFLNDEMFRNAQTLPMRIK